MVPEQMPLRPQKWFIWCLMVLLQTPLSATEMVFMVPNGVYVVCSISIGHHWAPYKTIIMVPNGIWSSTIGHHRNGLYGPQLCVSSAIGHCRNAFLVPIGVHIVCSITIGHHRIVYIVPNSVCLGTVVHYRDGLYGAQWCFFKHHWAPYKQFYDAQWCLNKHYWGSI